MLEPEEVKIVNPLPKSCQEAESVEDFFIALEQEDGYFESLVKKAEENNRALRMCATLDGTEARIQLTEVDQDHPFYTLDGSDNMIAFTTDRYKDRPLVVKGPGAGAEVTAAGVFAEIIQIGNFLI